jgi:hypothetical protein
MWDGDRDELELNIRPGSLVYVDRASQPVSITLHCTKKGGRLLKGDRQKRMHTLRNFTLRKFRLRKFSKTKKLNKIGQTQHD